MSWTIPGEHSGLTEAVEEARKRNILMFGAASDQGANIVSMPYMAKLSQEGKGPVICIGGAHEEGYGDDKARSEAEFFFPGQTHGIPEPLPSMKSNFGRRIGSSVATALAVGLTALIMLLVEMSPKYGVVEGSNANYRRELQSPDKIRKIFRELLSTHESNRPDAWQKDAVINVPKYFNSDRLNKRLKRYNGNKGEKGLKMLDGVLKDILW
jgi:hypothetical protein